jgi:FSR family fosmidomycin resistance protein-like MFS transporter
MSILLDALFNSVAYGHFIVDVLNGQRSILLTYWSAQNGMSNATLALITTIYIWVASLSQPVFGWVSDRFGKSRLLAGGGIIWLAVFYSLAFFLPMQWAIPCIILASLGSASFHPIGTMQATLRGRTLLAGRESTSTSWFFFFGQFGYFIGPILGGPILQQFGPRGLVVLVIPALVIGVNAWLRLKRPQPAPPPPVEEPDNKSSAKAGLWFVLPLAVVAALQSTVQSNMSTFTPKYMSDLGQTAAVYGAMAGLYMGGSGIGNVLGGIFADRYGRRKVASIAMACASLPILVISFLGWSPWLFFLIPFSGMFTGAVHSIIVVQAQRIVRGGMALVSGLTLGFIFSAGALGTMLFGSVADRWGFPTVFQASACLALVAALVALAIRQK